MTCGQRTRIYCCLMDCGVCKAHRGEFCRSKHGRIMYTSYHCSRQLRSRFRFTEAQRRNYESLVKQIQAEGEIVGHE